jgi:hypothetical protein
MPAAIRDVILLVHVRTKYEQPDGETRLDVEQSLKDLSDYEIVSVEVAK